MLSASALAVACFVGAGMLVRPVNTMRRDLQLFIDPSQVGGLPADLALLGKLGPLRALAIDWASLRAERLKEQGKTYEALQLHEAICALQPRFAKVWAYAAWNMAYNVSVMQYSPEARWQWVKNGITILRDKGIRYNPRSVTLHKELGWIYWHKIGDFTDDEHLNYKRALAVDMERVLGPPPIVFTEDAYLAWFRKIVDAPDSVDELLRNDAEVARLATRLATVDLQPDANLLEFIARNIRPELRVSDLLKAADRGDPALLKRLEVVKNPANAPALERLLAAVRKSVLRDRYKLDVSRMMALMEDKYGPLDWRGPYAHSLYWTELGDEKSKGRITTDPADSMNTARLIMFSLKGAVTHGRIVLVPNFDDAFESFIDFSPDTRYIPYLYATYLRLAEEQFGDTPKYKALGIRGCSYWPGFVSAMQNWIELLYFEGGEKNREQAENFFTYLRDNNPNPDGSTQRQYLGTLDDYVLGNIKDQLQTYKQAGAIIRSFIRRSLKETAVGHETRALRLMGFARDSYDEWMGDTKVDPNDRRKLQPLRILWRDEIEATMTAVRIRPIYKARLWHRLQLEGRQLAYDRLEPYFKELCSAQDPPWDPDKAFPEPPGMDAFRKQKIEYRAPARIEGVDQGERDFQP